MAENYLHYGDNLGILRRYVKDGSQTEGVIARIEAGVWRDSALLELAGVLAEAQQWERLLHLIHRSWKSTETRSKAFTLFPLVVRFISHYDEPGMALFNAFHAVDSFLEGDKFIS
jgi:hypothetical protein